MLILYPNPILRQKARKITAKEIQSPEVQELIFDMLKSMEENNGLGLAAPQIGKSLHLCIIKIEGKTHILINPILKSKSWRKTVSEEGCLSFPGKFILVRRHKKVTVKALDKEGKGIVIQGEGLLSNALQHEIDHLDGILFIDREIKNKKSDGK